MVGVIGKIFRIFMVPFFVFWIIIPLGLMFFSNENYLLKYEHRVSKKLLDKVRTVLMALVVSISFMFFAHLDFIINKIGSKYVEGYSVYYSEDVDDYGRSQSVPNYSAGNWTGKLIIQVIGGAILVLCIGIPVVAWKRQKVVYNKLVKKE